MCVTRPHWVNKLLIRNCFAIGAVFYNTYEECSWVTSPLYIDVYHWQERDFCGETIFCFMFYEAWVLSQYQDRFPGVDISIITVRPSWDRLKFIMRIPLLVRRHPCNESPPVLSIVLYDIALEPFCSTVYRSTLRPILPVNMYCTVSQVNTYILLRTHFQKKIICDVMLVLWYHDYMYEI